MTFNKELLDNEDFMLDHEEKKKIIRLKNKYLIEKDIVLDRLNWLKEWFDSSDGVEDFKGYVDKIIKELKLK